MARILLACSASVALYKACDLASKLTQEKHSVRTVLTPHAAQLVSPQLFEAVTGERAFTDEFGDQRAGAMDHIELAKWCELYIAAPASANAIARLANGLADDLASTIALALDAKTAKLVCPAMNPNMLTSRAVERNLARLREDGWQILDPDEGHMACGDEGKGRLVDPARIVDWVRARSRPS